MFHAFLLLVGMMGAVWAGDLSHAPKNFLIDGQKAVFVDFTNIDYTVTYDLAAQVAQVKAVMSFHVEEEGMPLFDVVTDPTSVKLDGQAVKQKLIDSPEKATQLRMITKAVATGVHTLEILVPLTELVEFKDKGVRSAFWMCDLDDRCFLEYYAPASFEFDQVKMTFNFVFKGASVEQRFYTNGVVKKLSLENYQVSFPEKFTVSSLFLHTAPVGIMKEINFDYRSIDGRNLPVTIYLNPKDFTDDLDARLIKFKDGVIATLVELEGDYGPFLHPSVTVYNAGKGGMEYCGATMTEWRALEHELTHSYFARGMMPANGNAGWIDEAIASWRDNGYPRVASLKGTSSMASHSSYQRFTDTKAYSFGAKFMAYLDGKFAGQGGLKTFLRHEVETHAFIPYFTEEISSRMSEFYNIDAVAEFKSYVYAPVTNRTFKRSLEEKKNTNPYHQKMSHKEMKAYL